MRLSDTSKIQCVILYISVLRDIEDRGRDLEQVLHQYTTLVKPAFEEFCLPVSFKLKLYLGASALVKIVVLLSTQII